MDKDLLPDFDDMDKADEEESLEVLDETLRRTETIDINKLYADELDSQGPFDAGGLETTSFGKLLQALPLASFLVDGDAVLVFANQACAKLAFDYEMLQGKRLSSMFADAAAGKKAEGLLSQVLETRKTQVMEGVISVEGKKIWGRVHIRSLRLGSDRSALVMIEDLTLEKQQLVLQKRVRKILEDRVEKRTSALVKANEQLHNEVRERRAAEQQMAEALHFNETILTASSFGISTYRPDGVCVSTNEAMAAMLEAHQKDILNANFRTSDMWRDTGLPEDMDAVIETRIERQREVCLQTASGRDIWCDCRLTAFQSGREPHVLLIVNDITERKAAEEELEQHRRKLQDLVAERTSELNASIKRLKQEIRERKQVEESLRSSKQGFSVAFRANPGLVSLTGVEEERFFDVNHTFCRALGYTKDEVIGRTGDELKLWAAAGHREQLLRQLHEKGVVEDFETALRTKDGRIIVGSMWAELMEVDGEKCVLTTTLDITERKRAEADRNRMMTAFEQAAEGIMIADLNGDIRYVNPALEAMSGYPKNELLGRNLKMLRSDVNDPGVLAGAAKRLEEGNTWKGTLVNRKKDGSSYEVETTISPVKSKSGNIINLVVVERDVTKEVRLEQELRKSQKMEAIGTLAGGVSRDFDDLLMAVLGHAYLAKEEVPDDGPAAEDLAVVLRAGSKMRTVIEQLLIFSDQADKERGAVRIGNLIEEALSEFSESKPETITIDRESGAPDATVSANSPQLRRVILNLLSNACDAMENSRGTIRLKDEALEIESDSDLAAKLDLPAGEYVKMTVSDTGSGIDVGVLDRIFEPYFSTKKASKGTGMGLAVVHGTVKSHGGAITVDTLPGKGTSFHVFLPRLKTTETPAESRREMPKGSGAILFIDDEFQIAQLGKRILEALEFQVSATTDPRSAVDLVRASPDAYRAVITDFTMPDLTGLDVAKEIREIRPDMPMILCIGSGETPAARTIKERGFADVLMKPVTPEMMRKSIFKVLA